MVSRVETGTHNSEESKSDSLRQEAPMYLQSYSSRRGREICETDIQGLYLQYGDLLIDIIDKNALVKEFVEKFEDLINC